MLSKNDTVEGKKIFSYLVTFLFRFYYRGDLDDLVEGNDHYQESFSVCLNVFVTETERKPTQPAPWHTDQTKRTSDIVFSSQIEKDETVDNFGKYF